MLLRAERYKKTSLLLKYTAIKGDRFKKFCDLFICNHLPPPRTTPVWLDHLVAA